MLSSGVPVKDPTNHSPELFYRIGWIFDFASTIETGYVLYAVLAYPDLCGRGQTVLLPVQ